MTSWTFGTAGLVVLGLLATSAAWAPAADPAARPRGFVGREGTRFVLDGEPFYVAGSHTHYLPWGSQREVDAALEGAAQMNFNVIRFFITGFKGSPDGSVPTVWGWPHAKDVANMKMGDFHTVYWDPRTNGIAFNEDGFRRIDYVIKKAGDVGLRLNIAFMDFWQYGGGSQQMRAWYGSTGNLGRTGIEPPVNAGPDERYDFFFRDERTRADYKKLVHHILNRRNTLTGVLYKDDPTIFAWDLMNEPEVKSVELAQGWKTEMAAYVKSIDKNHLLSTGSEGFYGGKAGIDPDLELSIPDIDFGTWHTYPVYHDITPADVVELVRRHGESARRSNKPVLLHEFGYSFRNPDQLEVYQSWLDAVYNDPNSAGWLHWRFTSTMDSGTWAEDNGEGFDARNDGSPLAKLLSEAALRQRAKRDVPAAGR